MTSNDGQTWRALVLINAKSGSADKDLEPALAHLESRGIALVRIEPDEPQDINGIIAREAPRVDMIVLGGGDGTISGSAQAVMDAGKPLGILPMGTANDFARTLQLPFDLEPAARIIADGHLRHADVGLLNDRPFLNVASIGFSAEVARFHKGDRKRRLKLLSYVLSWIDAYRVYRPFEARIECDGDVRTRRCAQLAVGSGRHYGGGMTLSDEARIDDGLLHLYYVDPVGFLEGLRLLPALRFGTYDHDENVELLSARSIVITTRKARRINVDGELVGQTPARFDILPGALAVFAPPDANETQTKGD